MTEVRWTQGPRGTGLPNPDTTSSLGCKEVSASRNLPALLGEWLRTREPWQRNLYILWLAQATMALGFSFFFPFIPLFIQEIGVEEPGRAAMWSGIVGGVGGFTMMLAGPFWGILGDRYGRKKNVLRAMFGSALALALTGLVTDVYQLTASRVVLGAVGGAWVANMALASSMAPREKVAYSIGVLQSASFLGFTIGPLVGGVSADALGFRASFLITGALLSVAGLLVTLFVVEHFEKPETEESLGLHLLLTSFSHLVHSRGVTSVMLVIFLAQLGYMVMMPSLPLFVGTLSGAGSGAFNAGLTFSILGLAAVVSSLVMGRLSQRVRVTPLLTAAFLGGAIVVLPLLFIDSLTHLFLVIALLGLFNGALNTLSFGLMGAAATKNNQGAAYGMAQSAGAMAWGSGPALGGMIAGIWGLREVFLADAIVLLATGLLAGRFLGLGRLEGQAARTREEAEPAPGRAHT